MLGLRLMLAIVCVAACVFYVEAQMVGGLREEKPADKEIEAVIAKLKDDISKMGRTEYKSLEPISYRTQVVAGLNYFVKAKAIDSDGKESYIHVRAYRPFKGDVELTAVKAVEATKPLSYFQ